MERITILNPARLVFGRGSFDNFVADFVAGGFRRAFIVTIAPLITQIEDSLQEWKSANIAFQFNTAIGAEPSFMDFEKLLAEARDFHADSVIGIGGGSVLDSAKLVAAQLLNNQTTDEIKGNGLLRERKTHLVCIPTTAGTGSEVSPNAIFVDERGAKIGVISPHLVPDATYVDPLLTVSLPSLVTASTGIDALSHCLEAFTNKFSHPVIDVIALEGISLITRSLKAACDNGADVEARTNVALGSMYGGMCLGPVNTAAVHALAYPLGSRFHVSHGLSIALLLPHVMTYNIPGDPQRYARVARAIGVQADLPSIETAFAGVGRIKKLIRECNLPFSLREVGVTDRDIPKMAEEAMQVQRLLKNNIRRIDIKEAEEIYHSALNVYEDAKKI